MRVVVRTAVQKQSHGALLRPEEPPSVTTEDLLKLPIDAVKQELRRTLETQLDALFAPIEREATVRELELACWAITIALGRLMLMYALGLRCRISAAKDIKARGLAADKVRIRTDDDYWAELATTFGLIRFPLFAYRDRSSGVAVVTRTPAREEVLPVQRKCRSSELCLEWEVKLGSQHPFRRAQEALTYFTHGAVAVEDTTIARHMVKVGSLIDRKWTYRTVDDIKKILKTRATRSRDGDRPIVYASTDAHALRRYVGETWDAQWKMANGMRMWCIDRYNGATIHLGGEYTWGDCEEVAARFGALIESGHLPADGDYGDGLRAQIVFATDGQEWMEKRIFPLFPNAVCILDPYHLLEHLSDYAAERYGRGTKRAKRWYDRAVQVLLPGRDRGPKPVASTRKGHRKRRGPRPPRRPQGPGPLRTSDPERHPTAERLLDLFYEEPMPKKYAAKHASVVAYITGNAYRLDYERYLELGLHIGSGAMESLHRTASQHRLKIPGGRWKQETAQAIFNLRMMDLAGRWDEFWSQADLTTRLVSAFAAAANDTELAEEEAA